MSEEQRVSDGHPVHSGMQVRVKKDTKLAKVFFVVNALKASGGWVSQSSFALFYPTV